MIMHGTTPRALSGTGLALVLGLGAVLLPLLPTWAQGQAPDPRPRPETRPGDQQRRFAEERRFAEDPFSTVEESQVQADRAEGMGRELSAARREANQLQREVERMRHELEQATKRLDAAQRRLASLQDSATEKGRRFQPGEERLPDALSSSCNPAGPSAIPATGRQSRLRTAALGVGAAARCRSPGSTEPAPGDPPLRARYGARPARHAWRAGQDDARCPGDSPGSSGNSAPG